MIFEDTIASLATPIGVGGIAIIRISGDNSLKIAENIFVSKSKAKISENPRMMLYGHIMEGDEIIDEVLLCYMKGPFSYTAEDVIEINSHGGYKSVERILSLVLKNGARIAEKGEFTKRAFLNGRIDLSEAQGVLDIINSDSINSHKIANSLLSGKLSSKINNAIDIIKEILAKITVAIDFPEEDTPKVTNEEIISDTDKILIFLNKLLSTYHDGKILKDGINIAIIGRPNVGKSSLLNILLDEDRAIVTDIAGTTRDIIKERIMIDGIPVNIIDTAGIRETDDKIEKIGVEKSIEIMGDSDVIILILDGSQDLTSSDIKLIENIKDRKSILLINKDDKNRKIDINIIKNLYSNQDIIYSSMKDKKGIDDLKERILNLAIENPVNIEENIIITSDHHKDMIEKSISSLEDGKNAIKSGFELDTVQIDYYDALDYLGQITGETATEDLLDTMFNKFCIGK